MQNKNSFLGKGWAFPPEFSHNDNPTRMSNYEEDIRQSLIILLSTRTGERIHRPDYGTELYRYQFEQLDLTMETMIKSAIEKAVLLYEPRVSLDRIEINKTSIQDGILIIELYYTIRMNNVQQELTYPIYFDSNR